MTFIIMTLADHNTKVIGYFAYSSPGQVVCSDSACVIAGSEVAMRRYLIELDPDHQTDAIIRKTRFGQILQGLRLGGAYAFDSESYSRFYALARLEGLKVKKADSEAGNRQGNEFLIVKLVRS